MSARVKGMLLLGTTLLAGVLIGMSYERHRAPAHGDTQARAHHLMHRFDQELGLDSAQHAAITAILARRQGTVDSTWHAVRPHVRATLNATLQEIAGVLKPDQAAKYRKMVEVMHPGVLR
jgi:hypothetical protein